MSEKKVVGRNVAIALGIICIVLAVGLVGAMTNYTSIISGKDNTIATKDSQIQTLTSQKNQLQTWLDGNETLLNQTQTWLQGNLSQISSLNSQITSLKNQISSLNLQISSLKSQISSLNSQIANLQNQVNELNSIIDLENSTVWVYDQTVSQPARSYIYWTFSTDYAGYIVVTVHTSTTDNTYVRVIWSSYGADYDESITVGASGTAVFPVLPAPSIEVRIGNQTGLVEQPKPCQ